MQAEQLTRALEAGDFEMAEHIAIEYAASVAAQMQTSDDTAGKAVVLRQALDTLNNGLHLARVLRAHLAAEVRANSPALEYQRAASEGRHWQFEA
jgi:hypothetical protein